MQSNTYEQGDRVADQDAQGANRALPADPAEALERLMTDYGDDVLRTAFLYLGDRSLAEDVSQDAFVRAFRHWSQFRGDSSPKTWLMKITINLCLDCLGRKTFSEEPHASIMRGELTHRHLEEAVIERIDRTTVLKHVLALPARYREVVYLRYYSELSTAEIADAVGSPEGTVRGWLHRARQLLRECLGREGFGDE